MAHFYYPTTTTRGFFALLASTAVVAAALAPPGQLFNLSNWDLQLPVSNGNGGVVVISQPALASYTSEYFYTNASDGNSMTFWAPINGAHTSGSSYPRSELRELIDFNYSGTHILSVNMTVFEVPPNGKITIGQAHFDGVTRACSIFCELEWQPVGSIVSHVRDEASKGRGEEGASHVRDQASVRKGGVGWAGRLPAAVEVAASSPSTLPSLRLCRRATTLTWTCPAPPSRWESPSPTPSRSRGMSSASRRAGALRRPSMRRASMGGGCCNQGRTPRPSLRPCLLQHLLVGRAIPDLLQGRGLRAGCKCERQPLHSCRPLPHPLLPPPLAIQSGSSATVGGRVAIHGLSTSHTPASSAWAVPAGTTAAE